MQFTNAFIFQQRLASIPFCSSSVFFALSPVFFFEEFMRISRVPRTVKQRTTPIFWLVYTRYIIWLRS